MWRRLHSLPGLISALLLIAVALSGAAIATLTIRDAFAPEVQDAGQITVGQVAERVSRTLPGVEKIERTASGTVIASYIGPGGASQQTYIDVTTGRSLGLTGGEGGLEDALATFHRSLLLGDNGRLISGLAAVLMILVSLGGLGLMVQHLGGWRALFDRARGKADGRWHVRLSRLALIPLLLSSLTGVYIVLTEFDLAPVVEAQSVLLPQSTPRAAKPSPSALQGLDAIRLSSLRTLTFPFPDDRLDVFTVQTDSGLVLVDQYSGAVLERAPNTLSQSVYETLYALHTGEGMAWLAGLLALVALAVPVLSGTGAVIWWRRVRATNPRIPGNTPPGQADTIILVGSQSGTTWGFARTLHARLRAEGFKVHLAAMNRFRPPYRRAVRLLFLTATYGNGAAPASADRFLEQLADMDAAPDAAFAVLGFGDRAFPNFCQFAKDLDADLANHGWRRLMPPGFVSRQAPQAFAAWGHDLGEVLGHPLDLVHHVDQPPTRRYRVTGRDILGVAVEAPIAIVSLAATGGSTGRPWSLRGSGPDLGSLLGIVPEGETTPRYYSLSSAPGDATMEVCVRLQPGGRCSTWLHALPIGAEVDAFVQPNPEFQPPSGRAPLILIGAGTGLAPFMGMIADNRRRREIHLYWGGRDPASDFLYRERLEAHLAARRLTRLTTAFSRVEDRAYVQSRLASDAERLTALLARGATVMVCGGDAMAEAVREVFDGLGGAGPGRVQALRRRRRYLEDIY